MRKLKKALRAAGAKLRSRGGETIAEALIALLIASLAITMLAGMIAISASMIHKSEKAFTAYYNANNKLVAQSGDGEATKTAVLADSGEHEISLLPVASGANKPVLYVKLFSNDKAPKSKPVISYKYDPNYTPS